MNPIRVDTEYGRLREVIVGVPFMVYPEVTDSRWIEEAAKILPEDEVRKCLERAGKDSVEIGKFEAMERENRELIAILEGHGVTVHRPEVLSRERAEANFGAEFVRLAGVSQQYARDPILVVGDCLIENAMGSLYRRCDILGFRRLLLERLPGSGARWAAMPGLDYALMLSEGGFDKTVFPTLEGGDVILLGSRVLVGSSANRATGSSELGQAWLRDYLAPLGYAVELVRLTEDVLHLDVALSVPRPGLVVVCPEAFADGVPACFEGWRRIEVSREDARHLAVNGLPLDPEHYIMGTNGLFDHERLGAALEGQGITVYAIEFGAHTEDGGSIRCSTHPLVRDSN